jgi:heme exporter protein CcmD
MKQFLLMGGYAIYVWPAVALTLIVLGLNVHWAQRSLQLAQRDARRRLQHARQEPV